MRFRGRGGSQLFLPNVFEYSSHAPFPPSITSTPTQDARGSPIRTARTDSSAFPNRPPSRGGGGGQKLGLFKLPRLADLRLQQRWPLYRGALAFALALDRMVPERKRRVPRDTIVANDCSVYEFGTEQLEFPLTLEVRFVCLCRLLCFGCCL